MQGTATLDSDQPGSNLQPLFDIIIREIPAPQGDPNQALQLQVNILDYNDYLGRIGMGRIHHGCVDDGQKVALCKRDGNVDIYKINKLWTYHGLEHREWNTSKMTN